ncbi:DNA primase [Brevibacillus humidisoli]|uniref:DNA primase n=1 Tax=Brevibacillus humidisoli TaxID=2895522 RepID=UPI001E38519C|nr:DNA primase [Brevibacillus humidisoli]UFJ43141.1 DNA primase [Brevibacillus humidisoli]
MSRSTSEELTQQIRSAIDIVDLISEHVQLKKSGRSMIGLCPFHSEKTPSFHVSAERQFFHCFGCKAGGDVFSFIMQMEQLTFPEAQRKLAERAGIQLPATHSADGEKENTAKLAMYEAHKLVAKLYHHVLTSMPYGQKAMEYLRKRGMSDQTIAEFQIGFAPDSWDFLTNWLQKRGFSLPVMVEAGLLARSESGQRIYDRFRGRIMFPIHDTQGEVIGFGGRSLDGSPPKYLNSPESPLFSKSSVIFNLHRSRTSIRKRKQAILFEGYVDVISAWQAGIQQGIATLGTAFTEQQARMIRRNAEQVIICYDGDAAGQEATEKAVDLLQQAGCAVRVAPLPQGVDPDEYIRRNGAEAFSQNVLLQALPVTAFRLQKLRTRQVIRDESDQARYVQEALSIITQLPSAVERDMYERQLAEEFSLSLDAIKVEARKAYKRQKLHQQRDKVTPAWNNSINNGKFTLTKTLPPAHQTAERMLLYYMMRSREVADRVQQECGARFYTDEHSALAAYLYAYYAEGHPEDPGRFIHYVQDEKCKQLASGLAMMECKEHVSELEISDYIRQVNNYPMRAELDELRAEQQKLTLQAANEEDEDARRQTVIQAAMLGMRIHELENALKEKGSDH